MISLVDIRKSVAALLICAAVLVAATPLCQMVICDDMAAPMPPSSMAAIGSACAASATNALADGIAAQGWRSALIALTAATMIGVLAVPFRTAGAIAVQDQAEAPPRSSDPLGMRILI